MSEQSAFEPAKFLTTVNGQDYLEVKWRLVWLRSVYPDARIETELVEHQGHSAVFRALVSLSSGACATGWGSEAADDFGDYLEKAETKALGRALAALGFGTQFCPDYDFGADRQRLVDSPVNIRSPRGAHVTSAQARQQATPRQLKYVHVVAREAGLSQEDLELRAHEQFSQALAELSRSDMSALIEQLQSERQSSDLAS
ncbi:MAG TPA: hypothetical protein VMM78_10790 [Thermomicrobiales bacterium]|nr:hypothetical protein [Thermomicrobiales bacterium]